MTNSLNIKLIKSLCIIGIIAFSLQLNAQKNEAYLIGKGIAKIDKLVSKADAAFEKKDYPTAYAYFKEALEFDKENLTYKYRLAQSAQEIGEYAFACDAYQEVMEKDTANNFPAAKFYFLEMEVYKENYDNALITSTDLAKEGEKNERLKKVKDNAEFVDSIGNLPNPKEVPNPEKIDSINTCFEELNPVWWNGKLYYGSMDYVKEKDDLKSKREIAKTLRTDMIGNTEVWSVLDNPNKTVTHLTFTPSGQRMYFTICDYVGDSYELICKIYCKDRKGSGEDDWGPSYKLPAPINIDSISSTQPSVGYNANNEEVLYFVSNRASPVSKGGLDIWYSKVTGIEKSITCSELVNLGDSINTRGDEITPFYHFGSKTLYFSSNGRKGYGGYDIFKTKPNKEKKWNTATNMIEKLNSGGDDFGFFINELEETAFLVSSRGGCNPTELCPEMFCYDIYKVEMPCNTELIANLYEALPEGGIPEIKKPLNEGSIVINENYNQYTSVQQEGNKFVFERNKFFDLKNLEGSHEGFYSKTESINVIECEANTMDIYLPCIADLTISVYAQNEEYGKVEEVEIDDAIITLFEKNRERIIDQTSQDRNYYNYDVTVNHRYQIKVTHPDYYMETKDLVINTCHTEEKIYLKPIPSEFDTIACYFHHDIPKRKIRGVPNPTTDKAYNELYDRYVKLNSFYQTEFAKGEYGANIEKNKQEVKDFFSEKVDTSYAVLKRFKNDLLERLKNLPEGETYTIYIKGYTSHVGSVIYNKELAKRRIMSIRNYFTQTHQDAFNYYLYEKRNLEFRELALGEVGKGHDKKGDVKNNRYNPESAVNRRVEIIRIKGDVPVAPSVGGN